MVKCKRTHDHYVAILFVRVQENLVRSDTDVDSGSWRSWVQSEFKFIPKVLSQGKSVQDSGVHPLQP